MKTYGLAVCEETFKFLKTYFARPIKIKVQHGIDVLYSLKNGKWQFETMNVNYFASALKNK